MIIVNDSPNDQEYATFAASINDPRIHYHINKTNSGVNFSRNKALQKITAHSDWVIFLDDDDYLAPDALQAIHRLISDHPHHNWFITNRAYTNGTPITQIEKADRAYSYIWDYLLFQTCKGDVTHTIRTSKIHTIRFPLNIKQGEEWLFFYRLGLSEQMFYHDHNSTISDGYQDDGLNFRKRTRGERSETLSILFYEGVRLGIAYHPTFLLYLLIRLVLLIK